MMKLIDLHVHSTASDGSLSPTEVVTRAAKKGLAAMALTDHDTVAGVEEARKAAENLEIEVIPGIEISCIYLDGEIHMLGLFVDDRDPELLRFLADAAGKRQERNLKMLKAFQDGGFAITLEDLACGNPGTMITRAHFARALLAHGYVSSVSEAFKKYLNPDRPYYRKREYIPPKDAIHAIRQAGGFPALAHPCQYKLGWNGTEELIASLKEDGLMGVECFHSSNYAEESRKLCALAAKYSLIPTGGSDFHGAAKPDIDIGSGRGNLRVPAAYLDEIRLALFLRGK